MRKYKLTILQWIFEVPPLFIAWNLHDKKKRKASFHLVLKGIEKHEHNFIIPNDIEYNGRIFKYMDCDHEGCNMTNPV